MNLQIFWKIIASEMEFESPSHTILVREIKATGLREIERFTMVELQDALKHLRRNNCVDSNGIVAECFFHARRELHEELLPVFTSMLLGKQTTFSMILKVESSRACTPKTGGPHWAQAWKRNEIWTNCCCKIYYQSRDTENQWYYQSWELATIYASEYEYKIFTRMVEKRVKPILETQLSNDKIGFRFSRSLDCCVQIYGVVGPDVVCKFEFAETALIILTTMRCSMLWRGKGVLYAYSKCIATLYHDQVGLFKHDNFRSNGVWNKKAVLSSFLFNAGLEHARIK